MKAAANQPRHDVRIWNPVVLGGGHYEVVVISWGHAFCSVRLTRDVLRDGDLCPFAMKTARPWMARPDELAIANGQPERIAA